MRRHVVPRTMLARVGAVASAVMIGSCLAAGVAYADTSSDALSALPEALQPGLHSDYVASESTIASSESSYPFMFDLRHYGATPLYNEGDKQSTFADEGINYVTPVKLQNPFGTCWAFACTAASETSMLTTLDKEDSADGESMDGSVDYEKAASGQCGTTAYYASDLSERHLAYFVFSHPSTHGLFKSQAGEGSYLANGSDDTATMMNSGGMLFLGMSLYSTGIGPVAESVALYSNDEGLLQVPTTAALVNGNFVYKYFLSYEEAKAYSDSTWISDPNAIDNFNKANGTHLTSYSVVPRIASIGTWGVDQDKRFECVAELSNSNIIASNKTAEGCLTSDEINEIKRELNEGHAVSIAYFADQSRPSDTINSANSYMNTATWAQYTYRNERINHAVTIVGYDDNYAASNFTHKVYKQLEDGTWVEDTESTKMTTPSGNGAWIVKNSWGSLDQDDPLQQMNWGVDNSGYFYLSYYDKTISMMESFEYDLSEEAQERQGYESYQYDLASVSNQRSSEVAEPYKMTNVFDGPKEGGNSVWIRDLGCLTGSPNAKVTLEVYVMDDSDDATAIIDAGQPVATMTEKFDSAGFHRLHLDEGITIAPGQKFAVVQTTQRDNGNYEYTFGYGLTKTFVDAYNAALSPLAQYAMGQYSVTVINEGESLAKIGGSWVDWSKQANAIDQAETSATVQEVRASATNYRIMALVLHNDLYAKVADNLENFDCTSSFAIDNWTIKAYGDQIENNAVYRLYNPYTSEHLWTTDYNEYQTLKAYQWTQEGKAWTSPEEGAAVYRLYNPVLGSHVYTTDSNEVTVLTSQHGWVKDNGGQAVFYSAEATDTDATAIYRLYNSGLSQHLLTMDANEYGTLPTFGWAPEGIAFYALK